jgi:hypothetical protein
MIKLIETTTRKLIGSGQLKSVDNTGILIRGKDGDETLDFETILSLFKDRSVEISFKESNKDENDV